MYTNSYYMTLEEYRRIAAGIARQIAAEERAHKRKPSRKEDYESGFVSHPVSDGDYG